MSIETPERTLRDYAAEVSGRTEVRPDVPVPMGTHEVGGGVNIDFFSRHASRVRLELFDHPANAASVRAVYRLGWRIPAPHQTHYVRKRTDVERLCVYKRD